MTHDYLVIGAGISGAAAAFELAASGTVLMVEAEASPGYHSTGRSAALYTPHYGPPLVQKLAAASHGFLTQPPPGFAARALMSPRGMMTVAAPGLEAGLVPLLQMSSPGFEIVDITAAKALALAPLLRPELVGAAVHEPGVMDMDVALLHQGYLAGFKARGGMLVCGKPVAALEHGPGGWRVQAGDLRLEARIIINAAGAWADQIGQLAGAVPIGLVPKRRSAITLDLPDGMMPTQMPAIDFLGISAYLKPEGTRIMASLGDETPMEPQDVQPDDYDIAVLADWVETQTLLKVSRIASRWAGLRSFVADGLPVAGFDSELPDFFWLAAQGGYGIMLAPSLGRITASVAITGEPPADVAASGVTCADLTPARIQ